MIISAGFAKDLFFSLNRIFFFLTAEFLSLDIMRLFWSYHCPRGYNFAKGEIEKKYDASVTEVAGASARFNFIYFFFYLFLFAYTLVQIATAN